MRNLPSLLSARPWVELGVPSRGQRGAVLGGHGAKDQGVVDYANLDKCTFCDAPKKQTEKRDNSRIVDPIVY